MRELAPVLPLACVFEDSPLAGCEVADTCGAFFMEAVGSALDAGVVDPVFPVCPCSSARCSRISLRASTSMREA